MADLIADPAQGCCSPAAQASCCAPSAKAGCCDAAAAGSSCGCSAGAQADIRETVRERDVQAARAASDGHGSGCGCGAAGTTDADGSQVVGAVLHEHAGSAVIRARVPA